MSKPKGLVERLAAGDNILCAEGFVIELEARGYMQGGCYVPEIVLENPRALRVLHEEFVHAGSDVVEALMWYLHRGKLRSVGREGDIEKINKQALRIAREVADETGTLMAGGLCNTLIFDPNKKELNDTVRQMFKEQLEWSVQGGADFIIAETFDSYGEAAIALECIQKYAPGLPAVITITPQPDSLTYDGVALPEACRRLEEAGAAVVGLNCWMGPETILPYMQEVRNVCKGPVACMPVAFRTSDDRKTYHELRDDKTGKISYTYNLNCNRINRTDVEEFTKAMKKMGVQYMGLCCGGQAHLYRTMAEALGRRPPASRYSTDMTNSIAGRKDSKEIGFTHSNFIRKFGDVTKD